MYEGGGMCMSLYGNTCLCVLALVLVSVRVLAD